MNRKQRRAEAKRGPSRKAAAAVTRPNAAALLASGLQHHHAGRLAEAGDHYERILAFEPNHADALHLLGLVAHQTGRNALARELIAKAIQNNSQSPGYHCNHGVVLRQLGQFDQAILAFQTSLRLKPNYVNAYCNLGATLCEQRKFDEAIDAYQGAIKLEPGSASAFFGLGTALKGRGQLDQAVAAYRKAISIDPQNADAHCNLGATFNQQGRLSDALAEYRRAVEIKPDHADAHSNLGAALKDQNRLDEAIAACEEAIRIRPDHPEAHSNLGATLWEQGKLDLALAACCRAIALKPDLASAHNTRGFALMHLGKMQDARAAFERAIELAPRVARYRYNLGELMQYVSGDPHLAAMEKLLQDCATLPVEDQISLHLALGKAYEDLGRSEQALRQWRLGNALKRQQIGYDEAAALGALDRTREIFTADLVNKWKDAGQASSVPVFIIGMPRSGTSLVEQILASHPQVFGAGELTHFRRIMRELAKTSAGTPESFPELVCSMTRDDYRELGRRYLAEVKPLAPDARHITDKLPNNFTVAGLIHLALPNAAIIHVVRDPVDTCLSCFSKVFLADNLQFTYDLAELGRYYRHYRALMVHWHQILPPDCILDVRYEDVVVDLERQARRIIDHCGLEWDDRCIAFHQTSRPVRTASAAQVRQPLYTKSVGRWLPYKDFLSPLLKELQLET